MRDPTLTIEFIPAQPYPIMQALYNSSYHTDMRQTGHGELDGVDTWLDAARPFMKQPPWGQVPLKGACLEEVKELGNLALVDTSRLSRAIENSLYMEGLVTSIDRCIALHRGTTGANTTTNNNDSSNSNNNTNSNSNSNSNTTPIFCRLNECSMKQSTNYTVRPFTNGADILHAILNDRRLISWLRMPKYAIRATTIYLADFDASFASKNEYRVFAWKGRVTGVSQYRWFAVEETVYLEEEGARRVCADIVEFMQGGEGLLGHLAEYRRRERGVREEGKSAENDTLPPKPLPTQNTVPEESSYHTFANANDDNDKGKDKDKGEHEQKHDEDEITLVADVVHTEGRVYLVEINLFGGETGCGSSLFHWKRDEDVLYGDGQNVVCRFLARAES